MRGTQHGSMLCAADMTGHGSRKLACMRCMLTPQVVKLADTSFHMEGKHIDVCIWDIPDVGKARARAHHGGCALQDTRAALLPHQSLSQLACNLHTSGCACGSARLQAIDSHVHVRAAFQVEGQCHPGKLSAWLQNLLKNFGTDIFRSKGVLSIAGSDEK